MRVLLDTNIVLDVLLERQPFLSESELLWEASEKGLLTAYITASTITDIFYTVRRQADLQKARLAIELCLEAFEICPVDRPVIELALTLSGNDLEDNLILASASTSKLDAVVSRDKQLLSNTFLPGIAPTDLLKQLATS